MGQIIAELQALLAKIFSGLGQASAGAGTPSVTIGSILQIAQAIRDNITLPLNLPANVTGILLAQARVETGDFSGNVYRMTGSLWNRHVGNGRPGIPNSDGFWTGRVYVTGQGEHLRTYSNPVQCAVDFRQYLSEFPAVLAALRTGDASAYGVALDAAGFSTTPGYGQTVAGVYTADYSNVA